MTLIAITRIFITSQPIRNVENQSISPDFMKLCIENENGKNKQNKNKQTLKWKEQSWHITKSPGYIILRTHKLIIWSFTWYWPWVVQHRMEKMLRPKWAQNYREGFFAECCFQLVYKKAWVSLLRLRLWSIRDKETSPNSSRLDGNLCSWSRHQPGHLWSTCCHSRAVFVSSDNAPTWDLSLILHPTPGSLTSDLD